MYKIDDEFRPPGRVFMRATRESTLPQSYATLPERKSNLKKSFKGPAITTNLDVHDRNIKFQHEVKHEKTIEALVTDYPVVIKQNSTIIPVMPIKNVDNMKIVKKTNSYDNTDLIPYNNNINKNGNYDDNLEQITKNKRLSTEILGSSMETTKTSQRATDGNRRITTHIIRKVTTLSRAEETTHKNDLINNKNTMQIEETLFEHNNDIADDRYNLIKPKRLKVESCYIFFIFYLFVVVFFIKTKPPTIINFNFIKHLIKFK